MAWQGKYSYVLTAKADVHNHLILLCCGYGEPLYSNWESYA